MKKPSKTTLTKKCDAIWSGIIRSRGRCERCGKTEGLQAAHIITRSNRATRWDVQNGLCLCAGCHLFWAHKEPLEFSAFVENNYPGRVAYLLDKKQSTVKITIPYLEELKEQLNACTH